MREKQFVSYHGKLEKKIHKEAKRQAVLKDITLIQYINSLIEKDLAEKGLIKTGKEAERELIR